MFKAFHIPLLQWSIYVKGWDPSFDDGPRWAYWRGRCLEHSVRVPVWRWSVEFHSAGKSYRELVGMPKVSLDWIIDEFDSSFNDLAIASLRYHMDFSVCVCTDDRRARFTSLVERLSEPWPGFTDAELAILEPPGWTFADEFEPLPNGLFRVRESTPEQAAVYAAARERELAWHERIQQARRDFVDVIPELWS
ncbi:hypothetical protein IU451_29095 [Nocardia cyriacigeorgica]|uniref:hypothetical protein n=1 Tax=Nocardia cyriacigeorgica TaxID=135487 RepID=UPI0018931DDB|nr:hypothetical protein [Nocardia cyriacigeorgica]MBF6326561.1 hypothetical protein [Nocardia cyriacigeorgica]